MHLKCCTFVFVGCVFSPAAQKENANPHLHRTLKHLAVPTFRRQAGFIVLFYGFWGYKTKTHPGNSTESNVESAAVYRLSDIFHLLISRFSDSS